MAKIGKAISLTVPEIIYLLHVNPKVRAIDYSDMIDTAIRWNA